MNNQEAFEIATKHMFAQGKRAAAADTCLYRTDTGLKCAIGALIPDDQYDESFESTNVEDLVTIKDIPALSGLDVEFLKLLQRIHDNLECWFDESYFKNMLRELAVRFDLDHRFIDDLDLNVLNRENDDE